MNMHRAMRALRPGERIGVRVGARTETESATDVSRKLASEERTHPHLFVLLERARPLAAGARHLLANIDRVTFDRGTSRSARRVIEDGRRTLGLQFPDARMSKGHAVLEKRGSAFRLVDTASTNGVRVNGRRVEDAAIGEGDVLEVGGTFFCFRQGLPAPFHAFGDVDASDHRGILARFGTMVPVLARRLEEIARVVRSAGATSILIEGEAGTGKQTLARALHEESGRRGPFVGVRCDAIADSQGEALLRGTAYGGSDALGFVRQAQGGTLYLDDVGALPPSAQDALTHALRGREVTPVGASRAELADVLVVAATQSPVDGLVRSGTLLVDLHAQLAHTTCVLPPLRERREDVGLLVAALLPHLARGRASALSLSAASVRHLVDDPWPANVSGLMQRLEAGVAQAVGDRIELAPESSERDAAPASPAAPHFPSRRFPP
jgi:transcriptional regulator of acetoin/glycerol metabolism